MAGVQIFTESPISPAVQQPQRTTFPSSQSTYPSDVPAGRETVESDVPRIATAIPISPPSEPVSTSASVYTPLALTQTQPPRSLISSSSTPSQPGHLPTPLIPKSRSPSPRREIPPPPRVGEKMLPASYYSPAPTPTYAAPAQSPYSPQLTLPYPSNPQNYAQPPASGISSTGPSGAGLLSPQAAYGTPAPTPTTAQQNFDHPPGYVQNPYAVDMTPQQRFETRHGATSPTLGYNDNGSGSGNAGVDGSSGFLGSLSGMLSPSGTRGGILNGDNQGSDASLLIGVGSFLKGVGRKVGEYEGQIWKKFE